MRYAPSFVLLVLAALSTAAPVRAQDQYEAQVRTLLAEAARLVENEGYKATHEPVVGSLDAGGTRRIQIDLDGGIDYIIMGVCDTDCSDVDLVLYDAGGGEVDSDVLADDAPMISASPTGSATFTIEVRMVGCSAEPCRYGFGVWGS